MDPELIKRLSAHTKIGVLLSEVRAGQFATSELAELAEILAADPAEKAVVTKGVIERLAAAKMPAGRVEDLRKAFGLSAAARTTPTSPAIKPVTAADEALAKSAASQKTRPVQPAFKVPFDAQPVPPPAEAQQPPAAPRPPAPLRGPAAQMLGQGAPGTGQAPPPAAPPPAQAPAAPRPANPIMRRDTMHFGGEIKGLQVTPPPQAGRPTVLVADDDNRIRMVFRIKLEEKGFNVSEAADGQAAWKMLETTKVDALILDMKMPGLHGLEILSRLSDSKRDLPVVVCTAYDRLDDEFVVATYPKLRYLTKPVDANQLASTLLNLLSEQGS